ncbi:Abi family protein [Arcanobacterium haemolyticum]|uniref:Uncharacterized protein n=1 Tax=Arcanobacterium haemolyticum (strain ATCC 9345 / DSM 20595 / CCM 5947 / CCUG 17215 / LMG 16163 / NBRC 15585 / NCTC 8452 / 11018) TaxID=644284 RepID=D7BL84_ARCHD|nr:Abi family protein [Arcanobacterium haemolyticum]ADH93414.1 hypothetical protein Arch_1732 [Arcanobacterium haemolyticum DSM 20595]QCX47412.1 Abi family protein [Arcanobacterium haemolyticum]SQH27647.1 Abortive infection bacteriophage resistance protein [Arcanobacterium haemolyticum]
MIVNGVGQSASCPGYGLAILKCGGPIFRKFAWNGKNISKVSYVDVDPHKVQRIIEKMENDLLGSRLPSVKRYRNEEELSNIPIWVAIETMTFGTLAKMSTFFKDKDVISAAAQPLHVPTSGFLMRYMLFQPCGIGVLIMGNCGTGRFLLHLKFLLRKRG